MLRNYPYDKREAFKLLESKETSATCIHALLLAAYPDDLYIVDVLELYARILEDFGVDMPVENENKLQALLLGLTTNAFYEDEEAFVSIASSLSSGYLGEGFDLMLDGLSVGEMLWAMYELKINRDDDPQLSDSVARLFLRIMKSEPYDGDDMVSHVEQYMDANKVDMQVELKKLNIADEDIKNLMAES